MRPPILVLAALLLAGCASVYDDDPRIARLQRELELEREAGLHDPVTIRREDRAAYQRHVAELLAAQYPPGAAARDAAVLRAVGLIDATTDLRAQVAAPPGEQVHAYYDPRAREVVLLPSGRVEAALEQRRLKHELAHALEDQTTGLPARVAELSRPGTGDLDQTLAAELLNEGGATWLARVGDAEPERRRAALVAALRRGRRRRARGPLLLTRVPRDRYDLGAVCVHDLLQAGGWEAFARLARGRLTSEQVLHPDKLGEPPVTIPAPRLALAPPWRRVGEDTLGEYLLRLLLEELAGRPLDAACAGWGGDRLTVYRRGARLAFAWRIDGDDAAAAERLARALGEHRHASRSPALRGAQIARRGERILIVGGVPAALRAAAARSAWDDRGGR